MRAGNSVGRYGLADGAKPRSRLLPRCDRATPQGATRCDRCGPDRDRLRTSAAPERARRCRPLVHRISRCGRRTCGWNGKGGNGCGDAVRLTVRGILRGVRTASRGKVPLPRLLRQTGSEPGNATNPRIGSGMQQAREPPSGGNRRGGAKPRGRNGILDRVVGNRSRSTRKRRFAGVDARRDVDGGARTKPMGGRSAACRRSARSEALKGTVTA